MLREVKQRAEQFLGRLDLRQVAGAGSSVNVEIGIAAAVAGVRS